MTTQVEKAEQNVTIIESRLAGMSCREIANLMNTTPATISRRLSDPDVRAVLDTATRELTSYVPEVIEGYADLIRSDSDKIKLEAMRDITKITGIAPTHTTNNFFTQINQQNNNYAESFEKLRGYIEYQQAQLDVIEGEVVDE